MDTLDIDASRVKMKKLLYDGIFLSLRIDNRFSYELFYDLKNKIDDIVEMYFDCPIKRIAEKPDDFSATVESLYKILYGILCHPSPTTTIRQHVRDSCDDITQHLKKLYMFLEGVEFDDSLMNIEYDDCDDYDEEYDEEYDDEYDGEHDGEYDEDYDGEHNEEYKHTDNNANNEQPDHICD